MSTCNLTTKHPIILRLGILAYRDHMSLSGLVAESDEVVFEFSFFHGRGSFSHTPPYMSIHNSTTKHPITLRLGILAYLDPMSLSRLIAESGEVVFESSFFH
jgi:hypothetical protein